MTKLTKKITTDYSQLNYFCLFNGADANMPQPVRGTVVSCVIIDQKDDLVYALTPAS
ncbi:MAG: hypothetical protein ACI8VC_000054 [Candidatus Endobugula sp.]|jgi:hypothetical protein